MNSSDMGPKPLFDELEIFRTLKLVGENEPVGRKKLARKLDLGEGSMRTILARLKDENYVSSTAQGHVLTEKGRQELEKRSREILEISVEDLTVGDVDVAVLVEDASEKVDTGIEQRDEAIKAGAEGATTLIYRDDRLRLSDSETSVEEGIESKLLESFHLSEGDLIIIGTANNREDAERGALAAAESLLD